MNGNRNGRHNQARLNKTIKVAPTTRAIRAALAVSAKSVAQADSGAVPARPWCRRAKMSGIMPDELIFSGMCELCPPYILFPRTCLLYCTGMRR